MTIAKNKTTVTTKHPYITHEIIESWKSAILNTKKTAKVNNVQLLEHQVYGENLLPALLRDVCYLYKTMF